MDKWPDIDVAFRIVGPFAKNVKSGNKTLAPMHAFAQFSGDTRRIEKRETHMLQPSRKTEWLCAVLIASAALFAACAPNASKKTGADGGEVIPVAAPVLEGDYRARLPQDEVIYFVIPDRFENGDPVNDTGGIAGERLDHGWDPTQKGFYHGGDLKGLIARLDYVQGLGATAIWLGPIYQNKAVQGPKGQESSGYHGYWITDFTRVDRHIGDEADMQAFVDAVHGRGMKLYLDIITNHTADVIKFRECSDPT